MPAEYQSVQAAMDMAPLSDREIALMRRLLSRPDLFPEEFKGWLPREAERNPPKLLRTDIGMNANVPYRVGDSVRWVTAAGKLIAEIKGIDAATNTITVTVYDDNGANGKTVTLIGSAGQGSSDFTVGVEDWIELPFAAGGWSHLDNDHRCSYRKDPFGMVHLRGFAYPLIAYAYGGANATIGTLPVGYRPNLNHHFVTSRTSGGGWLPGAYYVNTSGQIVVFSGLGSADTGAIGNVWGLYSAHFFVD